MKTRIHVVLKINSNEPITDQELGEEVMEAVNSYGRHCEYPIEAKLVRVEVLDQKGLDHE